MKSMFKKLMSVAALSAAASSVTAGAITDYSLNGNIVTNSVTGQEWLQWTETTGLTIQQAVSAHLAQGWRVASNADMSVLFNDFFTEIIWDSTESSSQNTNGSVVYGDGKDNSKVFGDLFGWTDVVDDTSYNGYVYPTTGFYRTYAQFGLDLNANNYTNVARVNSEHINNGQTPQSEFASLWADQWHETSTWDFVGVALIRDAQPASVSEPGSLALLGLGLAGLGFVRRKSNA